jgi:hypothetical protein
MDTREKIKVRQMIWREYRAGTDTRNAVINIRETLGYNYVSKSLINEWYKRFEPGEDSLFDYDDEQHDISAVIKTLPNRVEVILFKT